MHHSDRNIHHTGFTCADMRKPYAMSRNAPTWPIWFMLAVDIAALAWLASVI